MHGVRGHDFLTIATSPSHVFVHAHASRSARDPQSSRETLCTGDAPALHGRAAVTETVLCIQMCLGPLGLALPASVNFLLERPVSLELFTSGFLLA